MGDIWEDFYDILISKQREDEEEISWEDLKQELDINNKSLSFICLYLISVDHFINYKLIYEVRWEFLIL